MNAKELNDFNSKQTDWYAVCAKCGKSRFGPIEELKKGCGCDK